MLYRRKRRLRRQLFRFFFSILFFGGISTFVFVQFISPQVEKKVLNASVTSAPTPSPTIVVKEMNLDSIVEQALEGTKGKYSIVVKNLSSNQEYSRDSDRVFESASLYKLWVMAVVFQKIENGEIDKDDLLSQDVSVLNRKFNISSESAELTEGTVSLTVENALTKMITISDNYAALLLSEKVKLAAVTSFLKEYGLTKSKVGNAQDNPMTTARDTALFFDKLYKGEIVSKDASNQMLALLKAQKLNNKIPKYIPEKVFIAHKTGELGVFTHDAGIVYADTPFIIAILSESSNPLSAEERVSQVASDIYSYFTSLND